jgi:hypothetical protein
MARAKSQKVWSPWVCPGDASHGSTFDMPDGRFYCAHHGHMELHEGHAGGPRPASRNWFTLEDMERAMGLTRNADGMVTPLVDMTSNPPLEIEEDLPAEISDGPRCRECDGPMPPHNKPGRPPVKCEACRGS